MQKKLATISKLTILVLASGIFAYTAKAETLVENDIYLESNSGGNTANGGNGSAGGNGSQGQDGTNGVDGSDGKTIVTGDEIATSKIITTIGTSTNEVIIEKMTTDGSEAEINQRIIFDTTSDSESLNEKMEILTNKEEETLRATTTTADDDLVTAKKDVTVAGATTEQKSFFRMFIDWLINLFTF